MYSETITVTNSDKMTTTFIPKCNICCHNEVCKFKAEYNSLLRSIENFYYNNDDKERIVPGIFSIDLNCKYYKEEKCTIDSYTIGDRLNINPCDFTKAIIYNGEVPKTMFTDTKKTTVKN
jgi:hypothetical protein